MKSEVIDKSVWQEWRDFETRENAAGFFGQLLETCLSSGAEQMSALLQVAEQGDAGKVYRAAHTLKSTCATLGALGLAEQLAKIEAECKATPPVISMEGIQAAHSVFKIFIAEVQAEYDRVRQAAA